MLDHDLISLASWNAKNGPSFKNDNISSRIDRVLCRRFQCDAISKQSCCINHAPFRPVSGPVHTPIACSLPRPFIKRGNCSIHKPMNFQQKIRCREAWLQHSEAWDSFSNCAQTNADQLWEDTDAQCPLDALRSRLQHVFHDHFPVCHATPQQTQQPMVMTKWKHHAAMTKLSRQTMQASAIFRFWLHVTKFKHSDRERKKWVTHRKKQFMWDTIRTADEAAASHDAFSLLQVVNQFTPKHSRRKVPLRITPI